MHHCLSVLSIIVSTDPSGAVGEQCEGLLMPIYDPRADGPICTYGSPFAQICQFRFFRHVTANQTLFIHRIALRLDAPLWKKIWGPTLAPRTSIQRLRATLDPEYS